MSLRKLALAGTAFAALGAGSVQASPVAIELVLAIDVSGSIDANEYNLQRLGYSNAFLDPVVKNGILSFSSSGGVAVAVVQFSDSAQTAYSWRALTTVAEIDAFAADLAGMTRLQAGSTGVARGIAASLALIQDDTFDGRRRVIDVSGDGLENVDAFCEGTPAAPCAVVQAQRNAAAAAGVTINGLAIEDPFFGPTGVSTWYAANVVTAGGFLVAAEGFDDFDRAARTKIGREIIDVPEPMSLTLFGLGLAGLGLLRRRAA